MIQKDEVKKNRYRQARNRKVGLYILYTPRHGVIIASDEASKEQRRSGERARLGQGQMGPVLADYPIPLTKAVTDPDRAAAKRAFDAMMQMNKIDIAAIEAARRG
jgi:hypothetical protein